MLSASDACLKLGEEPEKIDQELSLYYVAHDIATTQKGRMIAIPESAWAIFSTMTIAELAQALVDLAQHVRLEACRKCPTRPKKSGPKPKKACPSDRRA